MILNLPPQKCDHPFGQERVASDIQQHSVQVRVIIGYSESLSWGSLMLHDTVMAKRPQPKCARSHHCTATRPRFQTSTRMNMLGVEGVLEGRILQPFVVVVGLIIPIGSAYQADTG